MSRVQLALNVADLDASIEFYTQLFQTPPAKIREGYANFAIADPPLKLVLFTGMGEPGSLNHVGVEVDLDDVDASSGVGELLIRGQNIVAGYWNKPEQTAQTFVGGWLRTGDLARVDDDGFVQIVDRKKDMVNRGGENVYCVEVENALVQHPDVFEVAVLGVPDIMMGEKVGAVIVPRPGTNPDPHEIRAWAKAHIADFKVPQFIALRAEPLPRNPGGKVLKPVLRADTEWGDQLR